MVTALELIYQYRQLAARCEPGGAGLSFEEIDLLSAIGALYARGDSRRVTCEARRDPRLSGSSDRSNDLWACRREFLREPVDLPAQLRGRGAADQVHVVNLGPGGLVCKGAPYLEEGERVELLIDDRECLLSYRFKADVVWLRDDDAGDAFELGLRFRGLPLLLRYRGQRGPAVARAA